VLVVWRDGRHGGGREGGDGCAQPAALGVGSITDADISEGYEKSGGRMDRSFLEHWNTRSSTEVLINLLCDDLLSAA
jgi:hypothetical protein